MDLFKREIHVGPTSKLVFVNERRRTKCHGALSPFANRLSRIEHPNDVPKFYLSNAMSLINSLNTCEWKVAVFGCHVSRHSEPDVGIGLVPKRWPVLQTKRSVVRSGAWIVRFMVWNTLDSRCFRCRFQLERDNCVEKDDREHNDA